MAIFKYPNPRFKVVDLKIGIRLSARKKTKQKQSGYIQNLGKLHHISRVH